MNKEIFKDQVFITGVLRSKQTAYLLTRNSASDPIDFPHSRIFVWHNQEWVDGGNVSWNCVSATVLVGPRPQLLIAGPVGEVLVMGSGDVHRERIEDQGHVPSAKSMIRGVSYVGEHAYGFGMQRQVYRRVNTNRWQFIGPEQNIPQGVVRGFESIDGFDESDIYAVGWEGEIWHFNGKRWIQLHSPTNIILSSVLCAGNGLVYACGQCGILLRGRMDTWEVIDNQSTNMDLWDIVYSGGKLFVSSLECLYCLVDDRLEVVDFGLDRQLSCYNLSNADDYVWSIGSDNVIAFDGKKWRRIA